MKPYLNEVKAIVLCCKIAFTFSQSREFSAMALNCESVYPSVSQGSEFFINLEHSENDRLGAALILIRGKLRFCSSSIIQTSHFHSGQDHSRITWLPAGISVNVALN